MKQENDILYLHGSDSLLTEDPENAYKVTAGTALVYVVKVTNGAARSSARRMPGISFRRCASGTNSTPTGGSVFPRWERLS